MACSSITTRDASPSGSIATVTRAISSGRTRASSSIRRGGSERRTVVVSEISSGRMPCVWRNVAPAAGQLGSDSWTPWAPVTQKP